jgi:hypothetical protein
MLMHKACMQVPKSHDPHAQAMVNVVSKRLHYLFYLDPFTIFFIHVYNGKIVDIHVF